MKKIKKSCVTCKNEKCFIRLNSPANKLEEISENKTVHQYKKSQHIFHEGNFSDNVFFMNEGVVKILKNGAFNRDYVIRLNVDGEILGHRGITNNNEYPVSAQTLSDSVVCQFSKDYFLLLLNQNPSFSFNLMMIFATELNDEEAKLRDIAIFNVREKVAKALLILINRFGLDKHGGINKVDLLTRQDIAACVGITSNQVTKVLGDFSKEKIIMLNGKEIVVLNLNLLNQIITI